MVKVEELEQQIAELDKDSFSKLRDWFIEFDHSRMEKEKSELFEKNKIRNFVNSSRLEGILISENPALKNLEEVINKYRAK